MSSVSWDEAVEQVCGEGAPFHFHEEIINGVPTKVFDTAPPVLRNLFDLARGRGDELYIVYEDEQYTFAEVMAQVDAIGAMLVDRYGIAKGDRVAIAMRNYPEWITSFAAITSIGAVAVPLNAWWTPDELQFGLTDSEAKVLIADQERVERLVPVLGDLDVAVVGVRLPDDAPEGVDRFEEVLPVGAPLPEVEVDTDDDATILYTSGTTGNPKGAVSTHRAIISALLSFACRAAINRARGEGQAGSKEAEGPAYRPCSILTVPLFHVTGCVPVMLGSFISGSKLVIMYKWDPERALQLVERERVTQFVGVPTMSWDMLEHPDFAKYDTSSLQAVGGGGAPAPPELVKRIEGNFSRGRPTIGYGMTETNAYGPGNAGDDYVSHPTSTGRVVPVVDLKVTDPDGNDLPPGEVGEIWFRGPHLIRGYWNRPQETAETIVDGWLRSGDIGRVDEEGFVYVVDRAKDMVLRGGENVYCAEVEAAIYEHPDVHEAAVFGLPHERLGEEVAAAIMPKPGHTIDPDELKAHVGQHLAPFKVPSQIFVHDEPLPRNAAGKILKRELRDSIVAGEGS
ncbi:MAG: class I adenylate-forming enzyme family protein [Acidimicrobiales bacterium]|nr:class I adenylate-forming enzyme family protein [Acidimicrobiales bacterium]